MEEITGNTDNLDINKYSRARKATLIEEQNRVKKVVEQLIQGIPTLRILDNLVVQNGLKISAAREYLTKGYKIIKELNQRDIEDYRAKSISILEEDYQEAKIAGERKLALDIQKEINKLKGAYEPEKIDITSANQPISINFILPKNNE